MPLTKFALSSGLRLTGLELVSSQENWMWCTTHRIDRSVCAALLSSLCLAGGKGREMVPASFLILREIPQHALRAIRIALSPVCPQHCVNYDFYFVLLCKLPSL